jgi:hypothetical protein
MWRKDKFMNDIWTKYNYDNVKIPDGNGVVYVIEYGDYIKIGSTKDIVTRYKQLYKQATDYCNVLIGECYYTVPHEKYKETEQNFHNLFIEKRKDKTELFNMSISEFFNSVQNFRIDLSKNENNNKPFIDGVINYVKYGDFNFKNILDKGESIEKSFRETYCKYCNDFEFEEIMDIMFKISDNWEDDLYFTYLRTRLQNIINNSHERYLETMIKNRPNIKYSCD